MRLPRRGVLFATLSDVAAVDARLRALRHRGRGVGATARGTTLMRSTSCGATSY